MASPTSHIYVFYFILFLNKKKIKIKTGMASPTNVIKNLPLNLNGIHF